MSEIYAASDIARIEMELASLADARRVAEDAYQAKRRELVEAKVSFAANNPHPLVGKRVWRMERFGYDGKTRRRSGTVTAYDPRKHGSLRELSTYGLSAGDPLVILDSGNTAWRLNQHFNWEGKLRAGETDWAEGSGQ